MLRRRVDAGPKPASLAQRLIQLAAIPVVAYVLINYLFQATFTVHSKGVILITGASTGIGRHAAESLALKGFHVFAGVRKESDANSIKSAKIDTLHPLILDVTQHESVVSAIHEVARFVEESSLPLVAVINNAGVARMQTAEFHSLDDARDVFATNYFGVLDMVQQTLPMLRQSKGRILMISSVAGFVGAPLYGVYSGSKFALEGLSDVLRREVADMGISVSVIQPGYVKTAISGKQDMSTEVSLYSKTGARDGFSAEEVGATYPHLYNERQRDKKKKDIDSGSSVDVTTEAIVHAVTDPHPRARYTVASGGGLPAWVISWVMWSLPDRVKDFVVMKLA
jgi:NAD(P)-dependent dehydrogenase (short-subunit alcohol dehydrogenase family)